MTMTGIFPRFFAFSSAAWFIHISVKNIFMNFHHSQNEKVKLTKVKKKSGLCARPSAIAAALGEWRERPYALTPLPPAHYHTSHCYHAIFVWQLKARLIASLSVIVCHGVRGWGCGCASVCVCVTATPAKRWQLSMLLATCVSGYGLERGRGEVGRSQSQRHSGVGRAGRESSKSKATGRDRVQTVPKWAGD